MVGQGIELIHATKIYQGNDHKKTALKDVTLTIKQGEFVGLLGLNGSGKSTLSRLLNGLIKPTSGKVYVNGLDTSCLNKLRVIRRLIGMVFQNPDNQIVCPLVEEEVAFGPENMGLPEVEVQRRVDWALEIVGMSGTKSKAPNQLSGGQKQKVALASVLAMLPEYLILDEPTSMLDPLSKRELLEHLQELNKQMGITIILISHNVEDFTYADRLIVLHQGSLYMQGTQREVFTNEQKLKEIGLESPGIYRLINQLEKEGFPVSDQIKTVPQLVKKICQR